MHFGLFLVAAHDLSACDIRTFAHLGVCVLDVYASVNSYSSAEQIDTRVHTSKRTRTKTITWNITSFSQHFLSSFSHSYRFIHSESGGASTVPGVPIKILRAFTYMEMCSTTNITNV